MSRSNDPSRSNAVLYSPGLAAKTGKIDHPLTNDVVFHSAVQHSNKVLRLLICSLSGLQPEEVEEVHLENPIDFQEMTDKEIVMDVKVKLNRGRLIDVELQIRIVPDDDWWIKRSLVYLCRCFDNLERSNDYDQLMPATQITIVPRDLFTKAEPEFYARYYMTNEKTGHIYTRDFGLSVVYLNHIDLATEADKASALDTWGRAFCARTWEELKEVCAEHEGFEEVAEMVYRSNTDQQERILAEMHDRYQTMMACFYGSGLKKGRKQTEEKLQPILDQKDRELAGKDRELERQKQENSELSARIRELEAKLAENGS